MSAIRSRLGRAAALGVALLAFASAALAAPATAAAVTVRLTERGFSLPVGTWDRARRSATLTADVDTLEILVDHATIDGDGHVVTADGAGVGVLVRRRTGVVIKDLTVGQPEWLSSGVGTAVEFAACRRCRFVDGTAIAVDKCVSVVGGAGNAVTGSSLAYFSPAPEGAYGVYAANSRDLRISGDTFSQATVQAEGAPRLRVQDNGIYGGGSFLTTLLLDRADRAVVTGNDVSGKAGGMKLSNSGGCTVTDNSISGGYGGLDLDHANDSLIVRNEFQTAALTLKASSRNRIYNNAFTLGFGGAAVDAASHGNIFSLPKPVGGNWWSDWTGPDGDGDGFVDAPFTFPGGSDRLPWTVPGPWPEGR